jgi:hypothetical protein
VDFPVYPGVSLSFAGMPQTCYLPILHISPYDLRVASEDVEGNFGLASVQFGYKV